MDDPSAIYQIILLLHIVAAIVGFGGVIANGAYNAKAFGAPAGEASVILRVTKTVTGFAHYGIYAVFGFGIILIALSSGDVSFGDPWVSASFVVWIALVGVAHGMVKPAVNSLEERAAAMDAEVILSTDTEATTLAKKLALGEGLTQLLLVGALVLMVWQFGA